MIPFFASTRPSRGFTLLELMLVVAILGILAAVTLPVFRSYALRAQAAEIVLVHGKHQLAFEELMAETGLKLGTDIRINTSQLKQVVEYTVKKPGATSQPVSGINYAELVLDREGVVLAYYSADYNATGPGQYKMNINVNPLITDPARKAQVMQLIMAAHYELKPYTYLNKITSDGVSLYFQIQ